jgi:alkylation response protein AidB-like acyl-CoA dehydrogenase
MAHDLRLDDSLGRLAGLANRADQILSWPEESWKLALSCGALEWAIPASYGGSGLAGVPLLENYERLARACLTTCFILSQRDAAVRRIRDSGNKVLCERLLPSLARGESFATVGLSQLTTSRQHIQASFRARADGSRFTFDGTIPWVSGAAVAQHLVIGAVLDDGRQVLAALPAGTPGVQVGPPLELTALLGSMTAEVRCDAVALDAEWVLAGPAPQVLPPGRGGTGGLETSCLALGLTGAAIEYLENEARERPDLNSTAASLSHTLAALRSEMHQYAERGCDAEAAASLRARANTLVLRATQAALTASKGTGFLRNHPAQRWARQALFFLVWSCPRPAAEATMAYLAPPEQGLCH